MRKLLERLPQPVPPGPVLDQGLTGRGAPVFFERGVAERPLTGAVMMAEAAFQRLQTAAKQLATAALEKITAAGSIFVEGKAALAAVEGGREDAKGSIRGQLQHHARAQPGCKRSGGLRDRPPTRPAAVRDAHGAGAGRRGRKAPHKSLPVAGLGA
jgi:hypothetical protein